MIILTLVSMESSHLVKFLTSGKFITKFNVLRCISSSNVLRCISSVSYWSVLWVLQDVTALIYLTLAQVQHYFGQGPGVEYQSP